MSNAPQKKIPELRFPEFKEEWVEKKLGDVGMITTGSTPITSNKDHYGGVHSFVSPGDIGETRYVYETSTKLTQSGFETGRLVREKSSLYVCIGSTIGKVAQAHADCVTNQQINAISAFSDHSPDYLFSVLERYSSRIKQLAGEQAVPIINKTTFSQVRIPF
ncbi:MAG: restriction endonuclease subunit S, partial [Kiritimatiellales bacterium]|nr:restriction endonuclease subunit S [Kiritimatiellales bacterium]